MADITTDRKEPSIRESHWRNRSSDRISAHSLQSKSQETLLNSLVQKHALKVKPPPAKNTKNLIITTNDLTERKTTIQTPAFSQRDPSMSKVEQNSDTSNQKVYDLLQSIKIMPLKNAKKQQFIKTIKEEIRKLSDESSLRPQIESIQKTLQRIEKKLKYQFVGEDKKWKQPPPLFPIATSTVLQMNEISPIRKLSPPKSNKVVYSNINLQQLCEDSELTTKVNSEEVGNVDNIEYYKIMHILGEKYQITPKKSQRTNQKDSSNSQQEKALNESVRISQLNFELQMLESILQSKKKGIEAKPPNKSMRDLLSNKKRLSFAKEKQSQGSKWLRSKHRI